MNDGKHVACGNYAVLDMPVRLKALTLPVLACRGTMLHARITKHGLFQFVMALTAGEMSDALEDLGTNFFVSCSLLSQEACTLTGQFFAAHVSMACTRLGSNPLKVPGAPTSISLQHVCYVVVSL